MLFWTVIAFVAYSVFYFIVSQRKIRNLKNNVASMRTSLHEKNIMLRRTTKREYEMQ